MLLEQIQNLYDSQLYDDVKTLASIALTFGDRNPEMLSVMARYQILCCQADALFHSAQYRQAEVAYQSALQLKKGFVKSKGKSPTAEALSEVEVKYRLYECYMKLRQFKEAVQTLKNINAKQRTSKINLALARLYQKMGGNDRSAVTAYKDVLRECPLSMVSIQALLSLGVKAYEIDQIIKTSLPAASSAEWLTIWIKSQAQVATKDFAGASITFRQLTDSRMVLRDNTVVLSCLGEAQFLQGDHPSALATLQRVHDLDPRCLLKMDLLSYLYYREQRRSELESLASTLMLVAENFPEPWIAMGYFSCATKKHPRAVYFAQKALCIDARNVEALLLKGVALMEIKKEQEAVSHFREALRLAPYRYEAYCCLIDGYVACDRIREAITCATESCRQLFGARTLTLYASVLCKDPLNFEKAKDCLEKAIKLDANYLDAYYLLANILGQQHQYENAIKLLRGLLSRQGNCRIHRLLAEFLSRTRDRVGATEHFQLALRINPNDAKAREGLARIEKHGDLPADRTFDVEDDVMDSSDNEEHFRPSQSGGRVGVGGGGLVAPQFEFDGSGSDGESDINSDLAAFS